MYQILKFADDAVLTWSADDADATFEAADGMANFNPYAASAVRAGLDLCAMAGVDSPMVSFSVGDDMFVISTLESE